jgi:hypothetical protein
MSVLTRATRRNNPEDTILHSHRRENLKSYIAAAMFAFLHLYRKILESESCVFPARIVMSVKIHLTKGSYTELCDIDNENCPQGCAEFVFLRPSERLVTVKTQDSALRH